MGRRSRHERAPSRLLKSGGRGFASQQPPTAGRPGERPSRRVSRCGPAAVVALLVMMAAFTAGCGCATGPRPGAVAPVSSAPPSATQPSSTVSATTAPTGVAPVTTIPVTAAPVTTIPAAAGSPASGDPYFPSLGNGGYDVQSYDISLEIDPVSGRIAGTDTVTAVALEDLSAFYLDLQSLDVSTVRVGGMAAAYQPLGQKLEVACPAPVAKGAGFTVTIAYSGIPVATATKFVTLGWQKVGDTTLTLDEPQGASSWFPVNDTPGDKATYTFNLTVPAPYTAVANGVLANSGGPATGSATGPAAGTARTFTWKMDEPMASYLAAVSVGKFVFETSMSAGGVVIRNYFAGDLASAAHAAFSRTGQVLDYFTTLFGPYPFAVYGVVVPDADSGGAMENQTMSLFGRDVLTKSMSDATTGAVFLSHELAHQWFGDSVTIEHWDDIWLNEGFATYASWLWLEHDLGRKALDDQVQRSLGALGSSVDPPPGKPGADRLFGAGVYLRGALTLHALRLTVGDATFFSILRAWADRHKYGNAQTADFIALAKEQAPQVPAARLDALFQAWLYADKMPALPSAAGVAAGGQ